MTGRHTLAASHLAVAVAAFGVASIMGLLQALSIADVEFPFRSESLYYIAVTAHGVLMALVFTSFFIMGLGYVLAQESLGHISGRGVAWLGFSVAVVGSVMAAITILRGQSTVLYTFYPPLQAHPLGTGLPASSRSGHLSSARRTTSRGWHDWWYRSRRPASR